MSRGERVPIRAVRPVSASNLFQARRDGVRDDEALGRIVGDSLEFRVVGEATGEKRRAASPLMTAVFGNSSADAKQSASNSFGSYLRRLPRSSTNSSKRSP